MWASGLPTSPRVESYRSKHTSAPCFHSGRRLRLRPQGGDRENVDVMGCVVAAEGRRRGNDGAKLGLGVAGRRVGGDLFAQALDVPDAVGHLGLAELDLQRRPATVAKLDDDVDLQSVRIAVVAKRSAGGARQARGIGPQVVDAQRLEEEAEGLPVGEQPLRPHAERGGRDSQIDVLGEAVYRAVALRQARPAFEH